MARAIMSNRTYAERNMGVPIGYNQVRITKSLQGSLLRRQYDLRREDIPLSRFFTGQIQRSAALFSRFSDAFQSQPMTRTVGLACGNTCGYVNIISCRIAYADVAKAGRSLDRQLYHTLGICL